MPELSPSRRWWTLAVLVGVYTFNFLDRQILGILKEPIRDELGLSDTELGVMGGIAFAAFYSTLGIPVARLADRYDRRWIMTGALATWSAFSAACGLAGSFWSLFAMRMGVGVGEAGGVAPAYSLIADTFPPAQRARALAVYSFGIPLGMALGTWIGGLLAAQIGWRWTFAVVGLAGLLLVPVLALTVTDPRGNNRVVPQAIPIGQVLGVLLPKPSFWLLALGASASSVCGYGVAFWLPTFFQRSLDLSLVETSWTYGGITLVGGIAGISLGGVLADRFGKLGRGAYAVVPAVCFLVALPFFLGALNTTSLWLAVPLFLVPTGLNLAWLGPVISAVQQLAPAPMRSTASALFLLVNNLVGIALGTYWFGWASDQLRPYVGEESMRWAILSGGAFYLVAAALLLAASRTLPRDWVEDRPAA